MKITADTSVLARAVLMDDPAQAATAGKLLRDATVIAISLPCLCELVWLLRRGARLSKDEVATTIRDLLDAGNVVMNRPAVEAGWRCWKLAATLLAASWRMKAGGWAAKPSCPSTRRRLRWLSRQGEVTRLLA